MNIKDFVKQYKNYPILFWGTGMSLRYLENSYTWENLLKKISCEIFNEEYFLELKGKYFENGFCDYSKVSQEIEKDFDAYCVKDRDGKFKEINDKYFAYLSSVENIIGYTCILIHLTTSLPF